MAEKYQKETSCSFSLSYHTVCVSKHRIVKRTSLCVTLKTTQGICMTSRPAVKGARSTLELHPRPEQCTTSHCTTLPLQHNGCSNTIMCSVHGCFQTNVTFMTIINITKPCTIYLIINIQIKLPIVTECMTKPSIKFHITRSVAPNLVTL